MKTTVKGEELIFSTVATDTDSSLDEFVVEFFEYASDMSCKGKPKKVIRNFDELIDFIESME